MSMLNTIRCIALSLLASSYANASSGVPSADFVNEPVRILFIGNSLTYYNDLPRVLEQIVNSGGAAPLETSMIAVGGATLGQHWDEGRAAQEIRRGGWDYVVLQEQSQLGARSANGAVSIAPPDRFYKAVRRFDAEIRGMGACTALLLTWAHEDKPHEQSQLDEAYRSIARELGAIVAPAGPAWSEARSDSVDIDLYEDNVHPTFSGTYLAAVTVAAALVPDLMDGAKPSVIRFAIAVGERSGDGAREADMALSTAKTLNSAAGAAVKQWRAEDSAAAGRVEGSLSPECAARQAPQAPSR